MTKTREPCPVARALDVLDDRWGVLILRDLLLNETRRFRDFTRSLRRISPNTLSARLKRLEAHGILTRRLYEDHPPRAAYLLTPKGRALGPAMRALYQWGQRYT